MIHVWIVLLMFTLPSGTKQATLYCHSLSCIRKLEALYRRSPEIAGMKVYQRGDGDNNFSHCMPFKFNERKA